MQEFKEDYGEPQDRIIQKRGSRKKQNLQRNKDKI